MTLPGYRVHYVICNYVNTMWKMWLNKIDVKNEAEIYSKLHAVIAFKLTIFIRR